MARRKPSYEELERKVRELRKKIRKAKKDLETSRAQSAYGELFFQSTPEAVIMADTDHRIQRISPQFTTMFGYAPEEAVGRTADELIAGETQLREAARITQKVGRGEMIRTEGIRYGKKGSPVHVELMASPVWAGSKRIGTYASYRDITERKTAEETLRASEKRYRELIEGSRDGYALVSLDGRIVESNSAFRKMLGYSERELAKKTYQDLTPLKWHDTEAGILREQVFTRGYSDLYEKEYIKKDGTVFPVELRTYLRKSGTGDPVGMWAFVRDVSRRKIAEESLKQSRSTLMTVLDSVDATIYVADLETHEILFMNQYMKEIFGHDLVGKTCWSVFRGESKPCEDCTNPRLLNAEGKPTGVIAWEGQNPISGRWYINFDRMIQWVDGRTAKLQVAMDITAQKEAETERKKLESQLHQAQRMQALGTLAGGIAHDFNNILMGIQGRTSLMLLDVPASDPRVEHLKGIEKYVQDGASLTRQLLGFARGGKYELKPTDLNELIHRSAQMFGRTKKEVKIHEKYFEGLRAAMVDRGQIEQVLLNLFVNAWQAMPGGGEIFISTENALIHEGRVSPYGLKAGSYVKVTVTDTGIGMDEETRQRVFEPFFTTKKMGRGTGLGLASAYGIVKNHGGLIDVESEKGVGTTFTVYLPASDKEIPKDLEPAEEYRKGTEGILFVDDEEMIRSVVKGMLESMGYTVWTAAGGEEAIRLFGSHRGEIQLVILDMIMPGMSGSEVFDRLKQSDPKIKVLLASGYSLDGDAKRIMERGCEGFIQKPFTMRVLSARAREILDAGR